VGLAGVLLGGGAGGFGLGFGLRGRLLVAIRLGQAGAGLDAALGRIRAAAAQQEPDREHDEQNDDDEDDYPGHTCGLPG
jgi:hypothetical protein